MALPEKVLITKAEKFEVKELQKITLNRERLKILDKLLNDAYLVRRPKLSEYERRIDLIRDFNEIAKDIYGNSDSCPVIEEFGSFSMDLFTTESDLDLSINFRNSSLASPRYEKIETLRKFARKFYALQDRGYVKDVLLIDTARVPIVKLTDTGTGVECDLSVENRDAISKSLIIRFITSIDQRFQQLSFLMKAWAKENDINSSKDRTLNSLSIILLVAFHLQTRDPPILPPFSAILRDGEDPESVERLVRNFENYGTRNKETLGELFVSFFIKLASVEKLWLKGLCASTYLGRWTSKTWNTKIASMSVEDFTDPTQNVARAVGESEVGKIYECIHFTNRSLDDFMNAKVQELELKESFFGIDKIPYPPVDPQLTIWQENYEDTRHIVTTNPILTVNNTVMDLIAGSNWSTSQPQTGHWGVLVPVPPLYRAVTADPEYSWLEHLTGTPVWGGPVRIQGWGHLGRSHGRRLQQPPYGKSVMQLHKP